MHTEIGHNCRGAKINGRIVPLNYSLQTGEQVEIITSKHGTPSRDWLNSNLGYITTSRARAKIVHWFKLQARDQNVAAGRTLIERELARLALPQVDFDKLADKANHKTADDMFAALGAGDLRLAQLVNLAQQQVEPDRVNEQLELIPRKATGYKPGKRGDIQIQGVGNLMTQMAGCCQPLPGDAIVGYITQGRGVSIHRQDCASVLQLGGREPERIIQVSWGPVPVLTYPVDIIIRAYDRSGLARRHSGAAQRAHQRTGGQHPLEQGRQHRADVPDHRDSGAGRAGAVAGAEYRSCRTLSKRAGTGRLERGSYKFFSCKLQARSQRNPL